MINPHSLLGLVSASLDVNDMHVMHGAAAILRP